LRSLSSIRSADQLGDLAHRLEGLLDAMADCVLFLDARGRILAASRAAEDLFGYAEIELLDADISRLIPAGLAEQLLECSAHPAKRLVLRGRAFDGNETPLVASLSPLDAAGETFCLVLREAPLRFGEPPRAGSIPFSFSSAPATAIVRPPLVTASAPSGSTEAETLELMFNATSTANEATTLDEALTTTLELMCHHFGWQLAHTCVFDESAETRLRSTEHWFGNFSPTYAALRRQHPADGLTGMALEAQRPQVLRASEAAARGCLAFPQDHSIGVAFPITAQGRVLAVVEAYSVADTEVQGAAQSILQLIGGQLGQVAEREQREQDLRAAVDAAESAGRQKSEFLSNMSHEFRTPMHAIINYTHLAQRAVERSDVDRARRSLGAIQVSGKRLLTLLNDILDLAKMEAGGFTCRIVQASFSAVVDRAVTEVESLAAAKSIQLTRDLAHTDKARFDETRVMQVLVNLLSNAIKFSPPSSSIRVRSADGELRGEPAVVCRVEDQGVGIPESEFESIFDKFEQSNRTKSGSGGTGLGLAICRQILVAHQGVIFAENRPEGGAVFTLSFPRGKPPGNGAE
jgi:PAS domain S-box-containing protein